MEKFENLVFEENQTTCSKRDERLRPFPCPNMSSAKFNASGEPYWCCELFKEKLEDDENKFLKRCNKCLNYNK